MSKITKKDVGELIERYERRVGDLERTIDGIEGEIKGLNLMLDTLRKMVAK